MQAGSEVTLGKQDAPKRFEIHTKAPALTPSSLSRQSILDGMAKSLKDLGTDTVCILGFFASRRGAYTSHTRWTYIISTAQMLELQSRKPCPPSRNYMLLGSSNAYIAPSCQAANASEVHVHILTLLVPSSASPTSSPTTSRKSTPSKRPRIRSSRQPTKATTTP